MGEFGVPYFTTSRRLSKAAAEVNRFCLEVLLCPKIASIASRAGRIGYEVSPGIIHFPKISMIIAEIVGQMSDHEDKTANI
jgi:hypothetical protein